MRAISSDGFLSSERAVSRSEPPLVGSFFVRQARRVVEEGYRHSSWSCRVVPVAASLFPRPVETRVMSPKKHEPKKDTSACQRCRISQHARCLPPLARLATRIVETRRFPSRGCPYRRPPAAAKEVFLDPVVTRSQLRRVGLDMSLPISRIRTFDSAGEG
jgi:hypothetical protein